MRKYHQLARNHRYQIRRMLARKKSILEIAQALGVHRSTVYREIKRNSFDFPVEGLQYDPDMAEQKSYERKCERRRKFLKIKGSIQNVIETLLINGWSPERISGRLKLERGICISHETIYRHVLYDSYGYGPLWSYLPNAYKQKRRLPSRRSKWIEERRSLEDLPRKAKSRAEIGHWERDLIVGKNRESNLVTVVDRMSRLTKIGKTKTRNATEVRRVTKRILKNMAKKSMLNDNGIEFMQIEKSEAALECKMYFTRPYSPWEKGTNENRNGVIRRYFPKGSDFNKITSKEITFLEAMLNKRPMKILGYKTPEEVFYGVDKEILPKLSH